MYRPSRWPISRSRNSAQRSIRPLLEGVPVSPTMRLTPGLTILAHPASAIFLDCGLGKSVITLSALFDLCLDSFLIRKVLVIAPLRVARDTWPTEIKKWDHLRIRPLLEGVPVSPTMRLTPGLTFSRERNRFA